MMKAYCSSYDIFMDEMFKDNVVLVSSCKLAHIPRLTLRILLHILRLTYYGYFLFLIIVQGLFPKLLVVCESITFILFTEHE
jgi:hypothetical protein